VRAEGCGRLNALLPRAALERTTIEHLMPVRAEGCGRSSAISHRICWNICRGTATSAIWRRLARVSLRYSKPTAGLTRRRRGVGNHWKWQVSRTSGRNVVLRGESSPARETSVR
jgi:hypothetical protein